MQWIIVFEDRPSSGIFRFLRKGFRHCYGFRSTLAGWQKLDALNVERPISDEIPVCGITLMAALAACGAAVQRFDEPVAQTCAGHPVRLLTCVEVLKRLLHQRNFWPFTPWQLFCALAKAGSARGSRLRREMG